MTEQANRPPDPSFDLVLTRQTHVPIDLVWKALTTPELVIEWFTPKPWKTVECKIELRPGGQFYTVMESPEGEKFPGNACILEAVENERFTWTSSLLPGYRPSSRQGGGAGTEMFNFTASFQLEANAEGTKYTAMAIHGDEEARKKHEAMGFEGGWGSAFDQLVELMSR